MPKTTMRLLPGLLLAAFASSASAAGFQLWEQNASGIGIAYAGSAAVADNASTIFYNPAGMTLLPGRKVSLGLMGVRPSIKFRDQGSTGVTGGNGGDAGSWVAVPNGYLSWQVAPQWFAGLGISSPFGLKTKYEDSNWIGRFHALKSEIETLNVNPSLAYRLSDKVSLGVGINYQKIDVDLANATGAFKGDDAAWGWNAGALFTLSPAMRVGVSYRSAVDYNLRGSTGTADLKLPDTFILSVWQQVSDRWEAMGDLSYTNWSTVRNFGAAAAPSSFNFRDSWRFAWGAAYKATDTWKTKFGIAYDRSPVTDADRSAYLPDDHRIWLSVGGQWRPARDVALDFGYAYIYLRDTSINQAALGGSNLRGRYDSSGHVLGLQYSQGF